MRWRRVSALLVLAGFLTVVSVAPVAGSVATSIQVPIPLEGLPSPQAPAVSAEAWIVYDETFDQVLGEHNADEPRPMASTTKMMTAIVVLENASIDDRVIVSATSAAVGEAEIGLYAGESLAVGDLLFAMLLQSANDAAVALAEHVGGSVDGFVGLMNDKAEELGLENSSFANPHGLDAANHYASAADLLTIARYGLENETFAEIVATTTYDMPPAPDGVVRVARLTNELVRTYDGAFGVKTGYTDGAGLTLIAGAERDGRRIFAVVMGSEDHFADSARLLNFGFEAFTVMSVFKATEELGTIRTGGGTEPAIAEDPVEIFVPTDNEVVAEPRTDDSGVVVVASVNDEVVGSTGIRQPDMPPLPTVRDAVAWASRYWTWMWGTDQ